MLIEIMSPLGIGIAFYGENYRRKQTRRIFSY